MNIEQCWLKQDAMNILNGKDCLLEINTANTTSGLKAAVLCIYLASLSVQFLFLDIGSCSI